MSKLTIRAAIEALTYADDQELINELENRAKKQFQENTYICHVCAPTYNIESGLYAFYAKSEDDLITQISECWGFCEAILWLFEAKYNDMLKEMVKDYDLYDYWCEEVIEKSAGGNKLAQKIIYTIVKMVIKDCNLKIKTLDKMMVARK